MNDMPNEDELEAALLRAATLRSTDAYRERMTERVTELEAKVDVLEAMSGRLSDEQVAGFASGYIGLHPNLIAIARELQELRKGFAPYSWWRVTAPDGSLWCETSDEKEARERSRPGDTLEQLWVKITNDWRTV